MENQSPKNDTHLGVKPLGGPLPGPPVALAGMSFPGP